MKEQRGYVRLDIVAQASYTLKGKNDIPDRVSFEDIGCNGIRVICNKKLAETDILELKLIIPGVEGDIILQGKPVWQRQINMDMLDTGIQFTDIDNKNREKLFSFIERETGRTVERREYVRCDFIGEIEYSLLNNPKIKKKFISIDVCIFGLKVMAKEQLDKGTQLCVEFKLPGQEEKIIAKCTVVAWVKKNEDNLFKTGIEFLEISDQCKEKIAQYIKTAYNSK